MAAFTCLLHVFSFEDECVLIAEFELIIIGLKDWAFHIDYIWWIQFSQFFRDFNNTFDGYNLLRTKNSDRYMSLSYEIFTSFH